MLVESVPFIKIWRSSKSLWKIEVNDKLNLIAKHVEIHFFHNLWTFRKIPWVFSLLCPMWTMDINYKTSVEIVYPNLKGCVLCEWCTLKLFSRGSWFLEGAGHELSGTFIILWARSFCCMMVLKNHMHVVDILSLMQLKCISILYRKYSKTWKQILLLEQSWKHSCEDQYVLIKSGVLAHKKTFCIGFKWFNEPMHDL